MAGSNDIYRVFITNSGIGTETIAGITTNGPQYGVSISNDTTTRNVSAVNVFCNNLAVSGTISGDVTGNVTGNVDGNVTGNVTGNLTGNVTGNVEGISTGVTLTSPNGTQYRVIVADDGTLGTEQV